MKTNIHRSIIFCVATLFALVLLSSCSNAKRDQARKNACINNQRLLEAVSDQLFIEGKEVTKENMEALSGHEFPVCPSGGEYTIDVGEYETMVTCPMHPKAY